MHHDQKQNIMIKRMNEQIEDLLTLIQRTEIIGYHYEHHFARHTKWWFVATRNNTAFSARFPVKVKKRKRSDKEQDEAKEKEGSMSSEEKKLLEDMPPPKRPRLSPYNLRSVVTTKPISPPSTHDTLPPSTHKPIPSKTHVQTAITNVQPSIEPNTNIYSLIQQAGTSQNVANVEKEGSIAPNTNIYSLIQQKNEMNEAPREIDHVDVEKEASITPDAQETDAEMKASIASNSAD
eukprot:527021_1